MIELSNQIIKLQLSSHGAEMTSLLKDGREYLWNADPKFWKRHNPVLFPIVGRAFQDTILVEGKNYAIRQHGFARDMDFTLMEQTPTSALFQLEDSEETRSMFPFPFQLQVQYTLEENRVKVEWKVVNPSQEDLHFQLGVHPAFLYPQFDPEDSDRGYLKLLQVTAKGEKAVEMVKISSATPEGYIYGSDIPTDTDNGLFSLDEYTFSAGALILEDNQVQKAVLMDSDENPSVAITFPDAPVFGIWAPSEESCPFVCLEPWAGRADSDYTMISSLEYAQQMLMGETVESDATLIPELKNRPWMNHLGAGETFHFFYEVELF